MCFLRIQVAALLCVLLGLAPSVSAQSGAHSDAPAIDGPAAPVAPEVVARESVDRVTVRATRIAKPIIVDGRVDDEVYGQVIAIGDLVQQEPLEGQPATEKTEIWLLYDDENIYVAARCWDSHPEREIAKEMRRDHTGVFDNEFFQIILDTFHDKRNGFSFLINLSGGLADAYVTDERDFNRDWNTIWDAKTARFDQGWSTEIVIPFKSLRYQAGREQVWGANFKRFIGWKNETVYLTRIPAGMGRRGINQISSAATLVGIEAPPAGRNFELKPYAIGDITTDQTKSPALTNDPGANAGLDFKMGVTKGLTADLTLNTDFAQVEVDEQQLNLTRFDVFFAEKREFFLEGQGIFSFGGVRNAPRDSYGPGGNNGTNWNPVDMPNLFFSRRIGLNNGQKIPIRGGGRMTGKAGAYAIGVLNIETGEKDEFGIPATNFGVVRVKRDFLRRSAIGALFTNRSVATSGAGSNQLFGVDGTFSFYENLNVNLYLAKTKTEGVAGRDTSYRAQVDYAADKYGLQLEQLFLDDQFDPQVGFAVRKAFRRSSAFVRYSPRPKSLKGLRKISYDATYNYIASPSGQVQSRYGEIGLRGDMQNGDGWAAEYAWNYEFLQRPFAISRNVTLPVGAYSFPEARVMYYFGQQRALLSGMLKVTRGDFYDGTRTELTTTRGRVGFGSHLSVEPGITIAWVDLPLGTFTTTVGVLRTTWTVTPRMTLAGLSQYISSARTLGTNIRFRWEYTPGSDVFVVYDDNRDSPLGVLRLQSRSFVVKFTRLLRR